MYQDPVHIRYLALATLQERRQAAPRAPRPPRQGVTYKFGALCISVGTWLERRAMRWALPVVPDAGI